MDVPSLLVEIYGRLPPLAANAVEGLTADQLVARPGPDANPIAWLIWHMARVQDHHVSEISETDQLWVTGGWASQFGMAADPSNNGYGHTAAQVVEVRPARPEVLLEYLDAAQEQTMTVLRGASSSDLDRIVDRRWNPPVTLGVRLVSVADDCLQHVGQAAYVKGLLIR